VLRGSLRRDISADLAVQAFEQALQAAESADEYWAAIQGGCEEFGLYAIQMQLTGHLFRSYGDGDSRSRAMRIPILESDWIDLSHTSGKVGYPTGIVLFANTICRVLTDKSLHEVVISTRKLQTVSLASYGSAAYNVNRSS
jgi:hypothetical protein